MEEMKVLELGLDDVLPNRFQPRIRFNEQAINELAESIKKHGVIQPIVVRPIGDKYEIIAGERRYKASVIAGKATIPAIITDLDDHNSAEVALIENVQRQDLTPIEEAASYKKILDMGYMTQAELATKLGKEQSTVANKLRLLNLHDEVQDALLDEEISERHARSLLRLNKEGQAELLKRIISERMTVRKTDVEIDNILNASEKPEVLDFDAVSTSEEGTGAVKNMIEVKEDPTPIVAEVNPGFIDVEKIENEAQDIFVEKPKNDVEALIQPTSTAANENAINEDLTPRKFFSFFPEEPVEAELPVKNEDIFKDINFNQPPLVVEKPVTVTEPLIEEPFKFDFGGVAPVIEEPIVKDEVMPIAEEPFKFDFKETITEEPKLETVSVEDTYKPFYGEIEDIAPIVAPTPEVDVMVKPDLKEVIAAIRSCTATIERYGFVVDTEEFDFEDIYQVIFKVTKK